MLSVSAAGEEERRLAIDSEPVASEWLGLQCIEPGIMQHSDDIAGDGRTFTDQDR